jgi:hypothetical protein
MMVRLKTLASALAALFATGLAGRLQDVDLVAIHVLEVW